MNYESAELAKLFEAADVGWVFEGATSDETPDEVGTRIRQHMREVEAVLVKSFPIRPRPALVDEIRADVEHFKPLLQAFASPVTAVMCAMIYAVLGGANVTTIRFAYEVNKSAQLVVVVEYESGESAEFSSDDVWDVEVLRHFGIMKLNGKPVIDGYYASRRAVD